jgi:plastocyanin
MTRRARLNLTACASALAVLAACGGGGGDGESASAEQGGIATADDRPIGKATSTLDVQSGDLFFKPTSLETSSGTITVNLENVGSLIHTLRVDGEKGFKLSVPTKGDTDTGEIRLPPGEYVLYCDIPGHRQANMEAILVVK